MCIRGSVMAPCVRVCARTYVCCMCVRDSSNSSIDRPTDSSDDDSSEERERAAVVSVSASHSPQAAAAAAAGVGQFEAFGAGSHAQPVAAADGPPPPLPSRRNRCGFVCAHVRVCVRVKQAGLASMPCSSAPP